MNSTNRRQFLSRIASFTFSLLAIAAAAAFAGCSKARKNPLSFQAPSGWRVEYSVHGDGKSYTLTANAPESGWLVLSQVPSVIHTEDISNAVQELAEGYRPHAESTGVKVAGQNFKVVPFAGEQCQGSYAVFELAEGGSSSVHVMYMMSVSGKIWFGQFMGSQAGWTEALATLKSVKLTQ